MKFQTAIPIVLLFVPTLSFAYSTGISGESTGCTGCHSPASGTAPVLSLSGPSSLTPGQTATYTATLSGGPGVKAGFDAAVDQGASLQAVSANTKILSGELTHSSANAMTNKSITWTFQLTAPSSPATVTLNFCGLSANGTGSDSGDIQGKKSLTITVSASSIPPPPPPPPPPPGPSPTDTVPPGLAFNIQEGSELTGLADISATATDDGGVARVRFDLDGATLIELSSPPYEFHFDTRRESDGRHVLRATARDLSGNESTATSNVVIVNGGGLAEEGCQAGPGAPFLLCCLLLLPLLRKNRATCKAGNRIQRTAYRSKHSEVRIAFHTRDFRTLKR